ncbi:UDP-galactose transporter 1 [Teratosphaeria destructans]|uniref:UDP-galactose transporter 1 n=1 Tax=Teratosphaeria destructans TaxID=418781 RepID=A0A9W7SJX9_9PEZI|nr:UDP-galactose transporter 1 [Teratosphaeria destructans]
MSVDFGPLSSPNSPPQDYFPRWLKAHQQDKKESTHRIPRIEVSGPIMDRSRAESNIIDDEKNRLGGLEATINDDTPDLEAATLIQLPRPTEYTVSLTTQLIFLGLYFLLNLGLTLSNKAVLQTARLPWLLTVMHSSATSLGCCVLYVIGHFRLTRLQVKEHLILIAFSSLFTLNIAISNVSLALVSVPFHQVLRSTTPVATIIIYRTVYSRSYSKETYLSMVPLILGVGLATFGDYYFSIIGFALTLLGVLLAAVKSVATNRLMTGNLALSALEVLFRMSPLAAMQCLLYAAAGGEFEALRSAVDDGTFKLPFLLALGMNALMAFSLNVVSFQTNKVAGALTVSVCGNLKQSLTILLGIMLFDVRVTALNGIGTIITLAGAAYYSSVELATKKTRERAAVSVTA